MLQKRPLDFVTFSALSRPHALWEEFFGPYPWFYAPLIGEIVANSGFKSSSIYNISVKNVANVIPKNWLEVSSWADWKLISQVQFRSALSQDLIRLDKAIMSCALIDLATRSDNLFESILNNKGINDKNYLIIPSTFVIDGIDKAIKNNDGLVDVLMRKTGQRRSLFDEISRGYAVVEYISSEIVGVCTEAGIKRVDSRLLKDRRDGIRGYLTRPASSQDIDSEKVSSFYSLKFI